MLRQEQGGTVQGEVGLIEPADEGLEDVGHAGGDIEDDVDLGVAGALGEPQPAWW